VPFKIAIAIPKTIWGVLGIFFSGMRYFKSQAWKKRKS